MSKEQPTLVCYHCGLVDDYHTVESGPHLKAICNGCGSYIKFIPREKKFTDTTPMPFGMHKGKALANVPADYFIYLYDNNLQPGKLRDYIEENLTALRQEVHRGR